MKKTTLFVLFIFAIQLSAQDVIYLMNGDSLQGEVRTIGKKIKYLGAESKRIETINREQVFRIVKGSGQEIFFERYDGKIISMRRDESTKEHFLYTRRSFPNRVYYEGYTRLNYQEFLYLLSVEPRLPRRFKNGKRLKTIGTIVLTAGAILIPSSLYIWLLEDAFRSAFDSEPNPHSNAGSVLGGGVALFTVGGIMIGNGKASMRYAIDRYNNKYSNRTGMLYFGIKGNSVGLIYRF